LRCRNHGLNLEALQSRIMRLLWPPPPSADRASYD
jgi:hypothetical protein